MSAAAALRQLRESLPGSPGVRAVASVLGYEKHNAYGYYESSAFKKDVLPLEKAREFAAAFERLGGNASDVLRLAGLGDAEIDKERVHSSLRPAIQLVQLSVALPSEDALTTMIRGLLLGVGLDEAAAEHSGTLARRLPSALAQIAGGLVPGPTDLTTIRGGLAQPPSTRHPD